MKCRLSLAERFKEHTCTGCQRVEQSFAQALWFNVRESLHREVIVYGKMRWMEIIQ